MAQQARSAGTEPHWLSEREGRVWHAWLAMRRALERGLDRELMESSGLSIADYQLLVPLSEVQGCAMRARDLGREVGWERSRLSHQIRRMEQRGLLERRECPTDARGTVIVLTRLGREVIEQAAPSHVEWVRQHFIGLLSSEEMDALEAVSARILARIASDGRSCCDAEDEAPLRPMPPARPAAS